MIRFVIVCWALGAVCLVASGVLSGFFGGGRDEYEFCVNLEPGYGRFADPTDAASYYTCVAGLALILVGFVAAIIRADFPDNPARSD